MRSGADWEILGASVLGCFSLVTLAAMTAVVEPEVTVTGCASPDAFARGLEELVGAEVVRASTAQIRVVATEDAGQWTTTLELLGDTPVKRQLSAESCEAGMEAAVVVAAMALDPDMLLSGATEDEWMREQPRPTPAPPKPRSASAEPEPLPMTNEPPAPKQSAWRGELELGAGGSLGTLPRANGLVRGVVAARREWLSVFAGASYAWPRTVEVTPTASARLQVWTATAGLCYVATLAERWDAPLCIAGHLGRMRGTGRGEGIRSRRGNATWGAAGLSATVRWWVRPHFGLYAGFEGLGVFARPDLAIEGEGQACCSSPVALSGSLGPAFRL